MNENQLSDIQLQFDTSIGLHKSNVGWVDIESFLSPLERPTPSLSFPVLMCALKQYERLDSANNWILIPYFAGFFTYTEATSSFERNEYFVHCHVLAGAIHCLWISYKAIKHFRYSCSQSVFFFLHGLLNHWIK